MHLSRLKIQNFKSLRDIDITPRKITILIGPNSGGKSLILQILGILKQSVSISGGYFRPSGDVVNLGQFSDVVSNHNEQNNIEILTGGTIFLEKEYAYAFENDNPANFFYRFSVGRNGVESVYHSVNQDDFEVEIETKGGDLIRDRLKFKNGTGKFRLQNNNGILPGVSIAESSNMSTQVTDKINRLFSGSLFIQSVFKNYFYIPSSRTMDENGVPMIPMHNNEIKTSQGQQVTMSQLVSYLSSSPPGIIDMVSMWTEKLFNKKIKTTNISTSVDGKSVVNVTIDFLDDQGYNSIVNDGSGTNQVILLLTLLGITPPRSVLGIEEPEIHLHPKAQADLAKILIDVSIKQEKQILFTTHSEHMLYPFLTNIASKKSLKPDDVAIYYFERDPLTKETSFVKLEIDDYGRIKGGLRGFFEENVNRLNEYLDAIKNESSDVKK